MKIEFDIILKQEHIKAGQKCECSRCPVAFALRDAFKRAQPDETPTLLSVGQYLLVYTKSYVYEADSPGSVIDWIRAFDSGFPVLPTAFTAVEFTKTKK